MEIKAEDFRIKYKNGAEIQKNIEDLQAAKYENK